MRIGILLCGLFASAWWVAAAHADGFAHFQSKSGNVDVNIRGEQDLEYYDNGSRPPGLLFQDHSFFNERLKIFTDAAVGAHWAFIAQTRLDRGFDPNDKMPELRLDEYFARYTWASKRWTRSLQLGKFATPLGNFVPRHDTMANPFVRAPMPYDALTTLPDIVAPTSNQELLKYRDMPDKKDKWIPVFWGPLYATGAMFFALHGKLDLRAAVTNSAPSERPEEWALHQGDLDTLVYSARVGYQPFPGFIVGLNTAHGPYQRPGIVLPAGTTRKDFNQSVLGADFEYSRGHLRVWSEIYDSRWEVPHLTTSIDALVYYVESRYVLRPGLFLGSRVGAINYSRIPDKLGILEGWDRDAWRGELGLGYFFRPKRVLAKLEYEVNHKDGPADLDDMLSTSLTLAF